MGVRRFFSCITANEERNCCVSETVWKPPCKTQTLNQHSLVNNSSEMQWIPKKILFRHLQRILFLLHSHRLLWMHICNEAINILLVIHIREASTHILPQCIRVVGVISRSTTLLSGIHEAKTWQWLAGRPCHPRAWLASQCVWFPSRWDVRICGHAEGGAGVDLWSTAFWHVSCFSSIEKSFMLNC